MKRFSLLLTAGLLVVAGCGQDDSTDSESAAAPATTAAPTTQAKPPPPPVRTGTKIAVAGSDYGTMLFDSRKQAIYIFQNDPRGKSVCYGDCAAAWPPVLTK